MNIAILIDAENVLPAHAELIFEHAEKLGTVTHREIYGAAQALTAWVAPVLKYAIHPNLTIRASKGKNSSDIALVIGAMDLLAAGDIGAVVIASSDSDFSALSVRLRNSNVDVIGMGTEKSNELWRTACSSFVTLQQPAKQQASRQQPARHQNSAPKPAQQPSKAQPQPAPKLQAADDESRQKASAATHEARVAVIRKFIQDQLDAAGGRIQTGALFPALNNLAEYRVDQQRSRRKPLNYLTRQYADAFQFDEGTDGNSWVMPLPAVAEAEPATEPETRAETGVSAETAPAEPAPADVVDASVAEDGEADPLALLIEAGLPEDAARQIVVIFTESPSLRDAYNRLRTTFGNTTGREYYQKVKEIAARQ